MIYLHIDDESAERLLVELALKEADPGCTLISADSVDNGLRELRSLMRSGPAAGVLVITDMKMPERDGLDFIREVRDDPAINTVPVVVLSTSNHGPDIRAAYESGAAAYHVKPLGLTESKAFARSLVEYWNTVRLAPIAQWPAELADQH